MSASTRDGQEGPQGGTPPQGAGAGTRRWPRRRLLRWALGLVPATMGGGWATFRWLGERERRMQEEELGPEDGWEVEGGRVLRGGPEEHSKSPEARAAALAQEAAWYSFAGNPSASTYSNLALKVFPSSAPARLIRACWYMQEDEWDVVRKDLSDPTLRDPPDARLLLEFIERVPRSPDWRQAFFDSWKALGQPDFRKSALRLQMFGSELTQHGPTREECIAAWVQLGHWEDAVKKAAYDRWPLAPLREESCAHRARNELAWMQAFAGLP